MPEIVQVAIVGGSGSGKTWLAQRLLSALAPNAAHIRLDDFYRGLPAHAADPDSAMNFDDPVAVDWDGVRVALDALAQGGPAAVPSYDFASHTRRSAWASVPAREFMIWDGLWLLHEPWLRERFHLGVFVDCAGAERLARRLARDVDERGRTPESVRRQFIEQVEPMRVKYVEPQRRWATCCLTSPPDETTMNALLGQIRAAATNPTRAAGQRA